MIGLRARALAPLLAVLTVVVASPALAQQDDLGLNFKVGGGWSQVHTSEGDVLDGEDGWYADAEVGWRLTPGSPLHFGIGFSGSYHVTDFMGMEPVLSPDPVEFTIDQGLFGIEPRLRWVFINRDGNGLYVAPRIGAGLLIGNFEVLAEKTGPGPDLFRGEHETNFGFLVRPGIEIGVSQGNWTVGAEASYMWGWVDVGTGDDSLEEIRAGVFFRFSL